ncbi:unnamed protein product [Cyprideis torosa]|uniref:Uncharacterized protein n=1 Tax=Cyprideis torosa TaxID=163714 RepID=A0A7R8W4L3_9CRUS|nr:unnamed protein product [Cyprideis torosa]CAG0878902.1 unnamed protein product [Cyprideis torosa]
MSATYGYGTSAICPTPDATAGHLRRLDGFAIRLIRNRRIGHPADSHPADSQAADSPPDGLATGQIRNSLVPREMGYEPVPPYATHTLLGKPAIGLPGLLSYLGHVKKADGFLGLWRGLQPKLVLVAVQGISCQAGLNLFDWATGIPPPSSECTSEPGDPDEVDDYIQESTGVLVRKAATAVVRDCTGKAVAVVCSQPFHVITIRCMAQFIGRETKYKLIAGSPPHMPNFPDWSVAWTELSRHNQLERGSSMLKRYYKGSPNLGLSIVAEPRLDQFRDPKIKLM